MAVEVHAIPGAQFMDPVVLARIGNPQPVSRAVVDGFINGLHRSPYFGASVDFAEHRGYVPGDDIRRVDWRLYARTDRYYIKEYEADSNSNFAVLLDVSRSMGFGSEGMTKLDYGRMLAGCLTYLVHKQRDRVGLVAVVRDDGGVAEVILAWIPGGDEDESARLYRNAFDVLLRTVNPALTAQDRSGIASQLGLAEGRPPFDPGETVTADAFPQRYTRYVRGTSVSAETAVISVVDARPR